MAVDPITLEIVRNGLVTIAEQISARMIRSATAVIVKEMEDCSGALFDRRGRLLAESASIPIHLNCIGLCLRTIIDHYIPIEDWRPVHERRIDVVIDLEGDVDHGIPTVADQLLYVYLPIHDGNLPDLDRLHAVARLGAELVQKGHRVLSHCGMGLNRSALIAGLVLMKNGMSGRAAVERLRERRPGALFNEVFADHLLQLGDSFR